MRMVTREPHRLLCACTVTVVALAVFLPVFSTDYEAAGLWNRSAEDEWHNKTVHVVFSNHVDIGFDGIPPQLGSDDNVINKYFNEFFPRAIKTAANLSHVEPYIWMTQAWLISMFLDCPLGMGLHCPAAEAKEAVMAAIRAGTITWHAFPFNVEMEMMEPALVTAALDMTQALDRMFGFAPKRTLSQRDVPGLSRAAIPILANPRFQVGLQAMSVGVNSGSAPPAVPRGPFWWRDSASGQQLLAMWHPGGYSGEPVDSKDDCMQVDGFNHVLCCAWKSDNAGPHTPIEVMNIMRRVRKSFPGAEVKASTFDAFVAPLYEAALPGNAHGLELPVLSAEIGDTWIHGIASDAAKLSGFRALQRIHSKLVYDHSQDAAFRNFTRLLLKIPEHTWGADTKMAMNDYVNWTNSDFSEALSSGHYQDIVYTWKRQYRYLEWAFEALKGSPRLWSAAQVILAEEKLLIGPSFLAEEPPQHQLPHNARVQTDTLLLPEPLRSEEALRDQGFVRMKPDHLHFQSSDWDLQLNANTGSISGLVKRWGSQGEHNQGAGHQWASQQSPLAQIMYSTYVEADYNAIWDRYAYLNGKPDWFQKDFGKLNCSRSASPRRADSPAQLKEVWVRTTRSDPSSGFEVVVKATFPRWAHHEAGAPQSVWLSYRSPTTPIDDGLHVTVTWVKKTPTRLPEALWVDWQPHQADSTSWRMWKLGSPVDPAGVLRNGSQSMHGVGDEGFHVDSHDAQHVIGTRKSAERLRIRTLDAALVSPGAATPFPNPDKPPDLNLGMHSLLAANIWGTNYVMWQPYMGESTQRFRFEIQVERIQGHQTV